MFRRYAGTRGNYPWWIGIPGGSPSEVADLVIGRKPEEGVQKIKRPSKVKEPPSWFLSVMDSGRRKSKTGVIP